MSETRYEDGWVPRSVLLDGLRNVKSDELTGALAALEEDGQIESRLVPGRTKSTQQWRLARPGEAFGPFGHSDFSDYSATNGRYSEDAELSETPSGVDGFEEDLIATMVANLRALTADELRQYREELDFAPADDPNLAFDREALARFDSLVFA